MTPQEFQIKNGFDEETMELIKTLCRLYKGKIQLIEEFNVEQAAHQEKWLYRKTPASYANRSSSTRIKP